MRIVLFLLIETYDVLPFFFATHLQNYLHAGVQECDMMISPTSLIKHCKIRDYAGPPRVTFQGYHIMCICWVSPLLDPSGILFYGEGWWKPWSVKSLNSNGNLSTGYWWNMIVIVLNHDGGYRYRTSWWVFISPYSLISFYTAVWKTKSISLLLFHILFHTKHSTAMIASRY